MSTTETITVNSIINGEKVGAAKQAPRENPANSDEIVGYWPVNTREDAKRAIDAAAKAFPAWAATPLEERIARMRKAIEKFRQAQDDLIPLLCREHGKPLY